MDLHEVSVLQSDTEELMFSDSQWESWNGAKESWNGGWEIQYVGEYLVSFIFNQKYDGDCVFLSCEKSNLAGFICIFFVILLFALVNSRPQMGHH